MKNQKLIKGATRDITRVRVVDYVSNVFINEDCLVYAVSQIGPTAINVLVGQEIPQSFFQRKMKNKKNKRFRFLDFRFY